MTRLEFTELFVSDLKPLWPDWKPEEPLIDLYSEQFFRFERTDVLQAFRKHKAEQDYQQPKIPIVIKHIKIIIAERNANERKNEGGPVWPGQAFLVTHTNDAGQIDFYAQPFCVNHRVAEVPEPFIGKRCTQHTDFIKSRFSCRYPGGFWACEVLTDETLAKRIREIKIGMMNPADQEKAAKVELAILDKKKFKDIHGMIEDLANKKSIAEQKAVLVATAADEIPF